MQAVRKRHRFDLAFVEMTTIREDRYEPIEEVRVQQRKCRKLLSFRAKVEGFEFAWWAQVTCAVHDLWLEINNLEKVAHLS